jgi:hypothetical protein
MQRLVARLLLSVFLLTTIAPMALAAAQPTPQHCDRKPLAAEPAPSGMHCHEAAAHAHHGMAAPATTPFSSDRQFRSNNCCNNHDCCNSTVRAHWAQFIPAVSAAAMDSVQRPAGTVPDSGRLSSLFDDHSGRAPPAL